MQRPRRPAWIYGPGADLVLAFCWVPLFILGYILSAGHGRHDDELLRRAVGAAFVLSFLHQPLTLGLVYGDAYRFRERRRLFIWAPPLTVAVIVVAVSLQLWVIIPVAAVWNTVHTLQQRYGLSRIYARKAGYGSASLDRGVLFAWMLAAVLIIAANPATLRLVRRVGLDYVNGAGVRLLTDARPVALFLLVPVGLAAVGLVVAIVRQEALAPAPNPVKWVYQGSSLLLIACLAVDPVAGFIAYVGAHAIEYFVVVYKTTEKRYNGERWRWQVACLAGVVTLALVAHGQLHHRVYDVILYTVGALHFLYDSFIWKLRKPAVAADFAIASPTR